MKWKEYYTRALPERYKKQKVEPEKVVIEVDDTKDKIQEIDSKVDQLISEFGDIEELEANRDELLDERYKSRDIQKMSEREKWISSYYDVPMNEKRITKLVIDIEDRINLLGDFDIGVTWNKCLGVLEDPDTLFLEWVNLKSDFRKDLTQLKVSLHEKIK